MIGATMSLMPSPLLALLVNETLKYGKKEGIKISLIPTLTDVPIITVTLLVMSQLSRLNAAFALISFMGFLFLTYLAAKGFFAKRIKTDTENIKPQNIKKGLLVNFLNPNAYIFWFTVGSPVLISGWKSGPLLPAAYLCIFYSCLVGFRVLMSFAIEKFRTLLDSKGYVVFSKFLSIALFAFALKLLVQGLQLIRK